MKGSHPTSDLSLPMYLPAVLYLAWALIRHASFRSTGFDLGFFENALWKIAFSDNQIIWINNRHILGDHASCLLYLLSFCLAPLQRVCDLGYLLIFTQFFALCLAASLLRRIAALKGSKENSKLVQSWLLHPMLLFTFLFDFHPDYFVLPGLFLAILGVESESKMKFIIGTLLILSTKEVMAVVVLGYSLVLLIERRFGFALIGCSSRSRYQLLLHLSNLFSDREFLRLGEI
jgi:uncharacterized membrane protein